MTEQEQLEWLRDPSKSLPAMGMVHDQKTGSFIPYDPDSLTKTLQQEILSYLGDPPRTKDGQTKWLTVLTARQMGKSLTSVYGCYPKVAYNPGWDHVTIADTGDRAEYLHKRVHYLHERWPQGVRAPTIPNRESRQLTFDRMVGGKMRVLSAETGQVGVGQSPDSFIASECAFWADFAGSMVLINPSILNRDNVLVIFECTPWKANSDWHEHVMESKKGNGRHQYLFKPFWDGYLNSRPWDPDAHMDNEEIRLMERYGPLGLSKDNLAFRRLVMDTDAEIRRHPELFSVFYPFDDVSCWILGVSAAIPKHALERHVYTATHESENAYVELHPPHPDSVYVIGVDPCGHAARDHAAFQVLELSEQGWTQVAYYSAHTEPGAFSDELDRVGRRYNNARMAVESNGVGQATLVLLKEKRYPNLYFEAPMKPGITTTSQSLEQMTAWLIDALLDELVLGDKDTVEQLMTYKHDKRIEEGIVAELVRGAPSKRRRDRHHWDKVSALMLAVALARKTRGRSKRTGDLPAGDNPIHTGVYNFERQTEIWKSMQRQQMVKKRDPWYRR